MKNVFDLNLKFRVAELKTNLSHIIKCKPSTLEYIAKGYALCELNSNVPLFPIEKLQCGRDYSSFDEFVESCGYTEQWNEIHLYSEAANDLMEEETYPLWKQKEELLERLIEEEEDFYAFYKFNENPKEDIIFVFFNLDELL